MDDLWITEVAGPPETARDDPFIPLRTQERATAGSGRLRWGRAAWHTLRRGPRRRGERIALGAAALLVAAIVAGGVVLVVHRSSPPSSPTAAPTTTPAGHGALGLGPTTTASPPAQGTTSMPSATSAPTTAPPSATPATAPATTAPPASSPAAPSAGPSAATPPSTAPSSPASPPSSAAPGAAPTTPDSSSPAVESAVADWDASYGGVFSTLPGIVGNVRTATDNLPATDDVALVVAFAQGLDNEVQAATALPSIPDATAEAYWTSALDDFLAAAQLDENASTDPGAPAAALIELADGNVALNQTLGTIYVIDTQ